MLEELECVENENLFLIQHCQELRDGQDTTLRGVQGEIDKSEAETRVLMTALDELPELEDASAAPSGALKECDSLDAHLRKLALLVRKTYKQCFDESSEVNTLTRLERLENELELMYQQSALIDPALIAAKQTEKDRARRDVQRREKAEKQEKDQKRKLEQALLRAQMPIKRRTGRPVSERMLPTKRAKNPMDEKKKHQEELHQDMFLYGAIDL
jgi:hypothetical protein